MIIIWRNIYISAAETGHRYYRYTATKYYCIIKNVKCLCEMEIVLNGKLKISLLKYNQTRLIGQVG